MFWQISPDSLWMFFRACGAKIILCRFSGQALTFFFAAPSAPSPQLCFFKGRAPLISNESKIGIYRKWTSVFSCLIPIRLFIAVRFDSPPTIATVLAQSKHGKQQLRGSPPRARARAHPRGGAARAAARRAPSATHTALDGAPGGVQTARSSVIDYSQVQTELYEPRGS